MGNPSIATCKEPIDHPIEMTSEMETDILRSGRIVVDARKGWIEKGKGLTEAMRPVVEAAATARLDCRRAFLNIVMGVQRKLELIL